MVDRLTKKRKYRKALYSRATLALVVVLLVLIGRATWGVYKKEKVTSDTLERVEGRHEDLVERKEFLKEETSALKTEEGIESEIREKFGLSSDGEGVIILVEPQEADVEPYQEPDGFWSRVKDFLIRE